MIVIDLEAEREARRQHIEQAEREPPALVANRHNYGACRHARSVIDYRARTLQCAECDAHLDPIEVLNRLANDGTDLVNAQQRLKTAKARLAELLGREKKAKARVRRWEERAKGLPDVEGSP